MGYRVLRSAACDADLETIFNYLFGTYQDLGDTPAEAFERAEQRLRGIEDAIETLGNVPLQGTLVPAIMEGLRHVTKDRAVFYFLVDESAQELRVLSVFFGGQDHRSHLLARIKADEI